VGCVVFCVEGLRQKKRETKDRKTFYFFGSLEFFCVWNFFGLGIFMFCVYVFCVFVFFCVCVYFFVCEVCVLCFVKFVFYVICVL